MRESEAKGKFAENRVTRQFCCALLFEGIARPSSRDAGGWQEWAFGAERFRARVRRGAFGRVRLAGAVERAAGGSWQSAGWECLLEALDIGERERDRLRVELSRTVQLSSLAREILPAARRDTLTYPELEAAIVEGHPYHPCFKARTGFTDCDNRIFGPETSECFQLDWLLLERNLVEYAPEGMLEALPDPRVRITTRDVATARRADRTAFLPLPVHPWQMRLLAIDPTVTGWIVSGRAIRLESLGERYRATQSVRTLMNADNPERGHLKLSLAIGNTSSLRTLDPHCVLVGPAISDWLAEVIASDPVLAAPPGLKVLRERAGAIAGRGTSLPAGSLAAIRRESPEAIGIPPDELVPFNALALTELDGRPLIDPWVRRHGLLAWLDRLVEVAVLPVWHLMIKHGIGLEAHAQNLLLRHEKGWPAGLVARDFHESLEYVPELLARPEIAPNLGAIDPAFQTVERDRYHAMTGPEDLRELVMDTLFVYNLAELTTMIEQVYGLSETIAWARIRARLGAHVAKYRLESREALFRPYAPRIATESLLSRTLFPGRHPCRHLVPNALSG
jgi:3,4-dihydroxybenzoyl-citryl-spermidine/N-citryl-spermidine--spermidine ligase